MPDPAADLSSVTTSLQPRNATTDLLLMVLSAYFEMIEEKTQLAKTRSCRWT